ncbi:MAG: asparagine synthase (glutamine-hydrolyzing) [Alphaproteobacteria bacterium]|nr:asparagine synthase (glutamine-hydrolyzing) [Alphaproteobacteria bacterium]
MCGIAGLMTRSGAPVDPAILDRLATALGHRGPDGEGRHLARDVGLMQRRLAIIDLVTGDQPLYAPGGAALVANGEIYNYVELRAAMRDVKFATGSDCETPLHLYERHGLDYARHLRGMYAIAIHDPARDLLVLSRDPFGIKPLCYAETAAGLAFASEPQALAAAGLVEAAVDPDRRAELLQLQFTTGADTIFRGVKRLLPGETVAVKAGRIVERRRIAALPEGGPVATSEAAALARLDAVLADSVKVHQRSDVPYAMFLSGGIDSTAVLAMMARLNERPVTAFTAWFPGTEARDERAFAQAAAAATGARHVEVPFDEDDFWSLLPAVAAAMDEPAADYATLPSYKLARAAARDFKVVLSGEGGDEMFAGYGRYRDAVRPWWWFGKAMRRRGAFDGLGVLRREPERWRDGIAASEHAARNPRRSKLQQAQATDCADWLPNDLLTKLDRCLMASGLEGRTPFLDPEVAKFAFALPDALKVRDDLGKWLLRRWVHERVPAADAFARKRGFTVPVGEWIARRGDELGELVARQPAIEEIAIPGAVRALYANPVGRRGFACWVLLFYALWHARHVEGRPIAGDVFDVLDAYAQGAGPASSFSAVGK